MFRRATVMLRHLQRSPAIHCAIRQAAFDCHCCAEPTLVSASIADDVPADAQDNEIKNGRLAMVAFLGFIAQHAATGKVRQHPIFVCIVCASKFCCTLPFPEKLQRTSFGT